MAWHSGSFHPLVPYRVRIPRDGRPSRSHVATVNSTGIDETSPQASPRLGHLSPYKKAGQGEPKGGRKNTKHHGKNAKQPSFSFFSLRLGARHPLSPACNPYTSTSVQGNTNLSSPLDVGPSFARTRINPRVFSLHHHPGKSHAAFTRWFRTPSVRTPTVGAPGRGALRANVAFSPFFLDG
jgi:hypothetical protein